MYKLHLGDSLNVLQQYPDNYFDSVVTDPPAGISFMNSRWDSDKGGRDSWIAWMTNIMQEVNRVLKPGGHILVWALPRTSHWTATAIEDAGFQVRDIIHHAFSQGFPKSRNISKDIDRKLGAESKVVEVRRFGGRSGDTPTAGASNGGVQGGFNYKDVRDITAPATLEAQQWDGWGTCLKPAVENWILARKPISEKTIVENVLKWGTGAINIDGCRIATNEVITNHSRSAKSAKSKGIYGDSKGQETHQTSGQKLGRFPANLVLSHHPECQTTDEEIWDCHEDCPVGLLDKQGDASRFYKIFYTPKASKKERSANNKVKNNHPTVKSIALMRYLVRLVTPPNGIVLDPFMGSGSTLLAAECEGFDSVGIEIEDSYYEIAEVRLADKDALDV